MAGGVMSGPDSRPPVIRTSSVWTPEDGVQTLVDVGGGPN